MRSTGLWTGVDKREREEGREKNRNTHRLREKKKWAMVDTLIQRTITMFPDIQHIKQHRRYWFYNLPSWSQACSQYSDWSSHSWRSFQRYPSSAHQQIKSSVGHDQSSSAQYAYAYACHLLSDRISTQEIPLRHGTMHAQKGATDSKRNVCTAQYNTTT